MFTGREKDEIKQCKSEELASPALTVVELLLSSTAPAGSNSLLRRGKVRKERPPLGSAMRRDD